MKVAQWHPAPPKDPNLLRRLKSIRYERAVAPVRLLAVLIGVYWILHFIFHDAGIGIMFGTWTPFAAIMVKAWSQRAKPEVLHLMDLPQTVPQFPVDVSYVSNGQVYGKDSGVISFVDGVAHYQGLSSSFDLDRRSTLVGNYGCNKYQSLNRESKEILCMVEEREISIRIFPFDAVGKLERGGLKRFASAVNDWCDKPSDANLVPIYPPLTPQPSAVGRSVAALRLVCAVIPPWLALAIFATVRIVVEPSFFANAGMYSLLVIALAGLGISTGLAALFRQRTRVLRELETIGSSLATQSNEPSAPEVLPGHPGASGKSPFGSSGEPLQSPGEATRNA